jgi:tripartite-type tricarboxylate transporter receptor subunit TctC
LRVRLIDVSRKHEDRLPFSLASISEQKVMKVDRRQALSLAVAAVTTPVISQIAAAQSYPARPVRLVVGFPPGGPADIFSRLIGQWLSERFGQQFVIENRPGAASNVATEVVARAPADGYTLLQVGPPHAINAALYDKLNYNFLHDIAPIAGMARSPNVMVVNPSVPANTVPAFIAYAKSNPGKINMASTGNGTVAHVAGELFKMMTGVNMVHVPYRGSTPALTDLLSGQVQVMFDNMPSSIGFIKAGKLRALAVTQATRSEALPDIPTVGEFLPGYEANTWFGIGAPKATPIEIVNRLNKEINEGLSNPKIKARIAELGGTVLPGSPAQFGRLIAEETEKWAKVVKFAGAKPD